MDSVQFLDAVRAKHSLPSDRRLAKHLEMPESRISLYRTGRRKLDPDACIAVAKALELPPEHVLASVQAERAKRTEHRRIWQRLAKAAKELPVVCVLGFVAATSTPAPSHATEATAQPLYILSNRRRRSIPVPVDRRRGDRRRRRHLLAGAVAAA